MQKQRFALVAVVLAAIIVGGIIAGVYLSSRPSSSSTTTSGVGSAAKIQIVAAENFWGSLVSQLGGTRVNVTSIVSDPNIDPHEYESDPANAIAITDARFVVVNGAGYDTWALNIISAESTPNQVVLNVQELIHQSASANPHFWYSPYYVNDTVAAMYRDLVSIDPADTAYFHQQYAALNASLWNSYMSQEVQIKQGFAGAPVASTESIFIYMANATGLDLVSPAGFMDAVAEGNDPSAQDVAAMENLMEAGNTSVHALVYNEQTVTPLTQNIKALAAQHQIPTIGVTETIQPPNMSFQAWMGGELQDLYNALNAQALGK
ncbi:MAG: zinc ABC transporter substrate-binding protein [Thaumarchaeota archaeon]|nr:zinc ABC transporter substrate-binding protein [Nitrososphaerota archaeon]